MRDGRVIIMTGSVEHQLQEKDDEIERLKALYDFSVKDLQGAVELAFRAGFNYGTRAGLNEDASWTEWKKRILDLKFGMARE